MAGIIVSSHSEWHVSGGGFRSMASGVMARLGESDGDRHIRHRLSEAVDSWLCFIDVTKSFSLDEVARFREVLGKYLSDFASIPKDQSPVPELYDGHIKRLEELLLLLHAEINRQRQEAEE